MSDDFETTDKYVVFSDGEWSALYVDGALVVVGDHYLTDERLRQILGVTEVASDAFMLGGRSRQEVAKYLAEIKEFEAREDSKIESGSDSRVKITMNETERWILFSELTDAFAHRVRYDSKVMDADGTVRPINKDELSYVKRIAR